jgi:steroid delta-isomerase-like uncharacterized protein
MAFHAGRREARVDSTTGPYRRIPKRLDPARPREHQLQRDASNHRTGPDFRQSKRRTTMTDSQTDGRTLAARYLKGLNDHDPDAVDGFVAVDYINHNAFVADGREANRAWWSTFFTAFPDIKTTMDDLVVAGDRVVGRFTYRGTHGGPLYGIPPTGNPIEMRSIDIWRTENGKFVEHWDELNYLELFQQIGVIPTFNLGDA